MGIITLNNIRLHAQHGCLKVESIIGSDYRVDVTDLSLASESDKLSDTDYVLPNADGYQIKATRTILLHAIAKRRNGKPSY